MTLAEMIAPGTSDLRLHFPGENEVRSFGNIWELGISAAARLRARCCGRPVAMTLTNSIDCATLLVGAIGAGLPVVSVPTPPRGVDQDWYGGFIDRVCGLAGSTVLVTDPSIVRSLPPVSGVDLLSYKEVLALDNASEVGPGHFVLTQFTSGSTSDPRGVVLTAEQIQFNLNAMVEWLEPCSGDGICTWLPLSHDMGLIGTFLTTLAAAARLGPARTDMVLLTPRSFIRNPSSWLQAMEEFGSTFTAAPASAFEMAARVSRRSYDLRRLRTCIVGGEPVSPVALTRFAAAMKEGGFDPSAFRPSYGMAEAVLAVAGTTSGTAWRSAPLSSLAPGQYANPDGDSANVVVSCGPPLPGYEVRIDGVVAGEILVRGKSLAQRDVAGIRLLDDDGWLHTRDLGVMQGGELFVLGRMDDVFQVAGRNIYAVDLEAHTSELEGICAGRVLALPDQEGVTIVAECESAFNAEPEVRRLALSVRQVIAGRVGISPRRVLLTRRGTLPVTASGKVRRQPLCAALAENAVGFLVGSIT